MLTTLTRTIGIWSMEEELAVMKACKLTVLGGGRDSKASQMVLVGQPSQDQVQAALGHSNFTMSVSE
jgi:hypothetical protein